MITPSTFVIGAGPVATALAGALRLGGVPVLGLWARRPEQARAAGATAGVAAYSAAPPDLLLEADVVLVAVRDDAISDVARMLVGTGLVTRKHVLIHCSGAISAEDAFASVRDAVGGVAAMHPLRAIADGREAMRALRGTVFGIEGDPVGIAAARALVAALGGTPLELAGAQMASYHAAAAIASNFLVALLDVAAEVMAAAGVDRTAALAALIPLARGTLDNLAARGVPDALTGPIRRGDRTTVARHLEAVGALGGDAAALYRALGLRCAAIARRAGAPAAALAAIEALLGRGAGGDAASAAGGAGGDAAADGAARP
ncbi:MAG: DUF2520 domain-containing protein [Deltaproteobacteria bacterium]|nr:MAG: DUF2520 domain-containing protein [Deltaproteobacteria bacterium]